MKEVCQKVSFECQNCLPLTEFLIKFGPTTSNAFLMNDVLQNFFLAIYPCLYLRNNFSFHLSQSIILLKMQVHESTCTLLFDFIFYYLILYSTNRWFETTMRHVKFYLFLSMVVAFFCIFEKKFLAF